MNRGANQFVLSLKAPRQNRLIETRRDQIVVGRPLAGQDRAIKVNQGKYERRLDALVLGLDMVNRSLVLNVCVVTGNH